MSEKMVRENLHCGEGENSRDSISFAFVTLAGFSLSSRHFMSCEPAFLFSEREISKRDRDRAKSTETRTLIIKIS